ncbi:MAG: 30S ribosomal protein S3 [Bacilli bacterium]|jgi:small subunit ribosomal protein S3|nr:30S ribosomal protein S3 [Bacilli bacterium]
MGQKVSPVGMRVGINRDWHSRWFANNQDFHKFLLEDVKVRKYLTKELKDALVSHIEIERRKNDKGHEVVVMMFVARPGVVIGQDGANINRLKKEVAKMLKGSQVRLDVVEVKQPDLDAQLVAQWIATELENRASFRTAQKKAIQRVRKAGAKGCKTLISGRLGGADIARSEGYKEGTIALSTLRTNVDFAHAEAVTAYGRLGVKVWISKPEPKKSADETVREGR